MNRHALGFDIEESIEKVGDELLPGGDELGQGRNSKNATGTGPNDLNHS